MDDKKAKSDIGPVSEGEAFFKKLGGMPPTKTPQEVIDANTPSNRKPAPESFRPGSPSTK